MKDIPSRYNPKELEEKIYSKWEKEGLFHGEGPSSKDPFTIVIPPPNITGILHMGHALNNTLQDILIRWKRMQGKMSLWMPGTDHAGIATQNVVEKKLAKLGKTRDDLGREEFLKEVRKWRDEYGSTIIQQLKRLGSSCDWARTRFTMDEAYSEAVKEAFLQLYNKGLVYQGDYIINWCPRCQTALSDEEAPHVDVEGKLYYIRYPFKDAEGAGKGAQGVLVATTRPETMLGDVAVCVNPKDRRYKKLIGKELELPIIGRRMPVIADDFVDKKFGTGAVKVTPAHDPNDFEIGKRHSLTPVLVMNPDGTMNHNAGKFESMDRFQAREAIVKQLKEEGLLLKIEPHHHAVGHCYRCHTAIEPYLSRQWFIRMKSLAKPAIEAVKKGRIKFYPKRWTKVYLNWMENIRDWCISRQIWWGHRIPVWYCEDCKIRPIVNRTKPEKCPDCGSGNVKQDKDVLDTWFSSWLWPFATFGWPEKTRELGYFYPTSALVTAPEILFFWVARMIMAGMEFMKEVPFKDVYIHGTVRDLTGKKMSKSLGNIIDPIDVIDEFGADALRYSMIAITSAGQDVYLAREKFEIGRNFANKIWNASRFVLMNVKPPAHRMTGAPETEGLTLADKWILSRLNGVIRSVTRSMENYRFNEAEIILYDFLWHDFCDWYVEMIKPVIIGEKGQAGRQKTEEVLMHVLESSLKLLHPFMPFVTEAVWQNIRERESIMIQPWPRPEASRIKKEIEADIGVVKGIIVSIRNIRSDMNIPYSKKLTVYLVPLTPPSPQMGEGLGEGIGYIKHLAHLERLIIDKDMKKPRHCASAILESCNVFISLEGLIDLELESARLTKKIEDLRHQLRFSERKIKDKNFISRAPEKIVNMEKDRCKKISEQIKRLEETLRLFKGGLKEGRCP